METDTLDHDRTFGTVMLCCINAYLWIFLLYKYSYFINMYLGEFKNNMKD